MRSAKLGFPTLGFFFFTFLLAKLFVMRIGGWRSLLQADRQARRCCRLSQSHGQSRREQTTFTFARHLAEKEIKNPFQVVLCLRIRLDSQSVGCVHSVGLGSSWLVLLIFLNVFRGSTSFSSLYISFA
jgi:hypothetical protein